MHSSCWLTQCFLRNIVFFFYLFTMASSMKRTAERAFEDPIPPTQTPVTELKLHVALSPIQFAMLMDRRPILPDPYSGRFGLRSDPLKAIERAHYFMNWSAPYAEPPPRTQIKKFMLCTVSFTPVGILTLQQSQILEPGDGTNASRPGYYRYTGPMFDQLSGEGGVLFYKFSDEFQELI